MTIVVSDGSAEGNGTLTVTVKAAGEVPIVAEPFAVLAYAGQESTLSPLDHVRGGSGTLRLNSVPAKTDVTITPSYETGTFRFTSSAVRTHYLEFVVTDGTQTVTGLVRVDVAAPPDANTKPITVPKTVFVKTLRNERIDVAGTDVDPAGGVLLVTGITNLPANSGVRAAGARTASRAREPRGAAGSPGDLQLPNQQRPRRGRGRDHSHRDPDSDPRSGADRH